AFIGSPQLTASSSPAQVGSVLNHCLEQRTRIPFTPLRSKFSLAVINLAGRSRCVGRPALFVEQTFWLCWQQQPVAAYQEFGRRLSAAFVPWGFALRFSCRLISACSRVVSRGCGGVGSVPSLEDNQAVFAIPVAPTEGLPFVRKIP